MLFCWGVLDHDDEVVHLLEYSVGEGLNHPIDLLPEIVSSHVTFAVTSLND